MDGSPSGSAWSALWMQRYNSIIGKYLKQMLHPRRDDDGSRRREHSPRLAIREHTHAAHGDVAEVGKFVRVLRRQHPGVPEMSRLHEHAIDDPDIDLCRLYWRAFHVSHLIETISVIRSVSPSLTVE